MIFMFMGWMQELIDVEGDGMADMAFRCIQEMDIDNRMMVCPLSHMKGIYFLFQCKVESLISSLD